MRAFDPDKIMLKAVTLANTIVPAFSNFMKNNSMLACLFNFSGDYDPTTAGQGMATRDMVMAAFENQSGLSAQKLTGGCSLCPTASRLKLFL